MAATSSLGVRVPAEEIKIGQIHPMTGALAVIGQSAKRGHDFAIEEINASGLKVEDGLFSYRRS